MLLGCIAAGLIQKPVISLAWDMRMLEQCISKIRKIKGSCHLIGCTAELLRQVFAAEAQKVVLEHARALAVAGKSWSAVSLRSLLRRLRKLRVRDASKRRGRMSQFTGPLWVDRVLESRANLLQFQKAGACLGQVFDTSAIAKDLPTVDALCVELKTRSRLPLVGKYSVPHLVRACSAARQHLDGTLLILGNDGWSKHMRTMHETRTTNQFQLLHVQSHADAVSMLRTVVHAARSFYTSRTATPFGRASLIDLPCQVCELAGVLGSVKSHRSSLANAGFVSSQAGTDQEALDRLEIYNYSHPSEGGYQLSREDGTVITEPGAPIPGSTLDLQRQRQAAAAPSPIPGVQDIDIDIPIAPPRGNWNGQWRVVDSDTGQELYRFGGIGNSQADANRVAADWLRQNAPKDADMTQIEVYPVLSEGRTQEDYDPSNPPGPESPPQMPAGTIKVDVSDMYDWYKLGQNISDLKSIDKSTLGKGPPSTVFAFGSEDLENMYSHALTRLGLKTHDLDEPGEEDLDEQIVNELKINNATGVGAVPYNREIDYHGLRVTMRPSMFLRLALPLDQNDPEERKAIEYCKSQLDDQGIGAPFLTITMPEAWESDDFSLEAKVRDHDGRHRCYAILDKEGDEPIEVHLLMSGGMRRRHISDSMIKNLRNGILNQQGQYVSGPIFDTAQ